MASWTVSFPLWEIALVKRVYVFKPRLKKKKKTQNFTLNVFQHSAVMVKGLGSYFTDLRLVKVVTRRS